mgnify:CR=1 FL=1
MADYYGYFSLVTQPKDTLFFSFYGYKTSTFIVPDTLTDNLYSILHTMYRDTINLPEFTVYPWPSKEEFARAFVEMNPVIGCNPAQLACFLMCFVSSFLVFV